MKIAVVTGASSGIGREFVRRLAKEYPQLEEIWVIARAKAALEELKKEIKKPHIRCIPMDLTKPEEVQVLSALLKEKNVCISFLVQAAGAGFQKTVEKTTQEELMLTTDLNCTALTGIMKICVPFCQKGSRIFSLCSGAAFLPQPGFAAYAASKAYVLSFSRALHAELRRKGVTVTSVCPGPVDTPFLDKMGGKENMPFYKKLFIVKPEAVVQKALKDGAKGKEISVYGVSIKALRVIGKLIPHSLILKAFHI